jgi:hypothetical protein
VSTLDRWRFEADGGDWDDVLRRTRRRLPVARAAVAVGVALAVAGPALGLVAKTTLTGKGTRPGLRAELTGPGGVHGTVTAFSPFLRVVQHGGRRIPLIVKARKRPVMVIVTVRAPGTITSARIGTTTVCRPCTRKQYLLIAKARNAVRLLFSSPTVTVTAGGRTLTGTLR